MLMLNTLIADGAEVNISINILIYAWKQNAMAKTKI